MTTRGEINSNFYQIVFVDSNGNPTLVKPQYIGNVANANYAANAGHANVADVANLVIGSNVSGAVNLATYATIANSVALANVVGIGNIASLNLTGSSTNVLYGNGAFAPFSAANANYANFAGNAFSVDGSNVVGDVANANHSNISDIANVAYSVDVANVVGIGNIATVNLDGNVSNVLLGDGTFGPGGDSVANANYANFAGEAFSVNGANVVGDVANATHANIADSANLVAVGNVSGIGNIATVNLTGSTTDILYGNGVFAPAGGFVGNANYSNFAGQIIDSTQSNITTVGTLSSLSVSGTTSLSSNLNMNGSWVNNIGYAVLDTDAASKLYVDTLVATGISYHEPVNAATTTTLATSTGGTTAYNQPNGAGNGIGAYISTTGTFANIDGVVINGSTNTRILVKDEANASWNGIYNYTNATAITRSSDADQAGVGNTQRLGINDYFFTQAGTVNNGTAFIVSAPAGTIVFGTSNITFSIFSTSVVYTGGTGITVSGTVISANASQTQVTAVGTLTSLSVTGNVNAGNVIASTLTSNVAVGTAPLNITSTTLVPNLYVARSNVSEYSNISLVSGTTVYPILATDSGNQILMRGNIANLSYNVANATLTAASFVGVLRDSIGGGTFVNPSGITVTISAAGFTKLTVTNSLVTANAPLSVIGNVNSNNVIASTITSNVATGTAPFVVSSNTQVSNLRAEFSNVANTANSVAVANVVGIGNIATLNLNGNSSQVLYGNGVFAPVTVSTANFANVANTVALSASSANGNRFLTFVSTAPGPDALAISFGIKVNPSLNKIFADYFSGDGSNLTGVVVSPAGTNTQIQFNDGGTTGANANLTFDKTTGTLTTNIVNSTVTTGTAPFTVASTTQVTNLRAGFSNIANIANSVAVANVVGIGNIATSNFDGNSSNALLGNGVFGPITVGTVANANYAAYAGNVTIASQPNITSLGTLTSLSATGNITGNILISTVVTGNAPFVVSSTTQVSNLTAAFSNVSNTANSVAVANVVGIGNIATSNFDGNSSNALLGNGVFGPVAGGPSANANYAAYAGNVTIAAQPNITSLGILTSLSVSGNIDAGFINANGVGLTNITAANVVGTVANANYAAYAGNITIASQPNITSTGTLTTLSVSGTATVGNITSAGLGNVSNVVFTKYNETVVSGGSVSGTITPNAAAGTIYNYTLTGNITMNSLANAVAGTGMTVILTQGGAGSYTLTSTMKFLGGTKTLSTSVGAIDIVSIFYDGTTYYATLGKGFA